MLYSRDQILEHLKPGRPVPLPDNVQVFIKRCNLLRPIMYRTFHVAFFCNLRCVIFQNITGSERTTTGFKL